MGILRQFRILRRKLNKHSKIDFDLNASSKLGLPVIGVKSNGRKFWFVIDTGAGYSTLNPAVLGVMETVITDIKGYAYGVDGAVNQSIYHYAYFSIGGKKLSTLCQVIYNQDSWKNMQQESGRRIAGLLGNNFLIKYGSTIDYVTMSLKNLKPIQPITKD